MINLTNFFITIIPAIAGDLFPQANWKKKREINYEWTVFGFFFY